MQFVSPLEDFPEEKWNEVLNLDLTSCFRTTKRALSGMKSKGYGRIVNIASAHAFVASRNKAAYVSSKHGLIGLTKVTALEYAGSYHATFLYFKLTLYDFMVVVDNTPANLLYPYRYWCNLQCGMPRLGSYSFGRETNRRTKSNKWSKYRRGRSTVAGRKAAFKAVCTVLRYW